MKPLSSQPDNNSKLIFLVAIVVMLLLGGFLLIFFGFSNKSNNTGQNFDNPQSEFNDNINTRVENNANVERTVQVLVTIRDIKNGEKLDPTMFRKETRPENFVKPDDYRDFSQIDGFFAKSDIGFRETIDPNKVSRKKPVNTITANIPEGYRAVTINVDVTSSVEGWARAGAFVDVVWNSVINGKLAATVITQHAKILSAERQIEANPQEGQAPVPSTVTLLVLADDATKIHLAETTGKLSLQLRGDDAEKGFGARTSLTIDDLLDKNNGKKDNKKYDAIVKIKGKNGKMERWGLKDGSLVLIE